MGNGFMFFFIFVGASACDHSPLLQELFYNNNGDGWINSSGWLSGLPLHQWYGVAADDKDCVIELNLQSNNLTGTLPLALGQISSLQVLNFRSNALMGTLPSSLVSLSNLSAILLSFNQISGTIPEVFQTFSRLHILRLSYNLFSGTIPTFLSRMPLSILTLGGNKNFTGSLSSQFFKDMPDLTLLGVESIGLSGKFPDLSSNSKLETLGAHSNRFIGPFPSLNCTSLQLLGLNGNRFTGTVPEWINTCKRVQTLGLGENLFEGEFPLLDSSELVELEIQGNSFTGNVLKLIRGLPRLEVLLASRNKFGISSGHSGVAVTHPTLHNLRLDNNRFTAKIDSISLNPHDMKFIDLSGNTLYCPLSVSSKRVRNLDILITDRCVLDWVSLMALAIPGVLGGTTWFGFLWVNRERTFLRFLVKGGLNQAGLVSNLLSLLYFLELLAPDINFNCENINSFEVFGQFMGLRADFPKNATMNFSTYLTLLDAPQLRAENIASFRFLCETVGGSRKTCEYDSLHPACVFNGDSHVQYTQGIREITITLVILLCLQQVISTWLVIRALMRVEYLTIMQRHLSYSSFLAFTLLFSKTTRAAVHEDVAFELGRRRLMVDFVQGVMLKGALLALNMWVVSRMSL